MTVSEEIQDAMLHGANAMFIIGLFARLQYDPEDTMNAFEDAAKKVLSKREIKLSPAESRFQQSPKRKWNDQEW